MKNKTGSSRKQRTTPSEIPNIFTAISSIEKSLTQLKKHATGIQRELARLIALNALQDAINLNDAATLNALCKALTSTVRPGPKHGTNHCARDYRIAPGIEKKASAGRPRAFHDDRWLQNFRSEVKTIASSEGIELSKRGGIKQAIKAWLNVKSADRGRKITAARKSSFDADLEYFARRYREEKKL